MKKLLFVCMGLFLVFGAIGCSSGGSGGGSSNNTQGENKATDLTAYDIAGLTTTKGTALDITLSATAPEGSTLTYVIETQPSHGTLVQKSGPVWTYTPMPNYVGSDSFTYLVNDGTSDSNVATVSLITVSNSSITSTGGQGNFNDGGKGGALKVCSYRNLSVTTVGDIDTSFDVPTVDQTHLGLHPAIIATNTVIKVLDCEPELGKPYMVACDTNLYISDGDGIFAEQEEIATGLKINQGVIVEVEGNYPEFSPSYEDEELVKQYSFKHEWICRLAFCDNVIILGTLKTKPIPEYYLRTYQAFHNPYGSNSKGSLGLTSTFGQVLVDTTGVVDLAGDKGSPFPLNGGQGGKLWVVSYGTMVLKGLLNTSGGEGTAWGGDGGFIKLNSCVGRIYNLGQITAMGGNGEGSGCGGNVRLLNERDDIYSSGSISTMGGLSVRGDAGDGGMIKISVGTEGDTGNLIMSGTLNSSGGESQDRGDGGCGGNINLKALTGNIVLAGNIMANGGTADGLQCNGGDGGNVTINGTCSYFNSNHHVTGLIQVASIIAANGGPGQYNGGDGGAIRIDTEALGCDLAWSHDVQLIGYQNIDVYGGNGSYDGGCGGHVDLEVNSMATYALLNEVDVMAAGGTGTGGVGGSGGCVNLINTPVSALGANAGTATNSGAIDISDGDGAYGVVSDWCEQSFYMLAGGIVLNTGAILATGGDALLGSVGGKGGDVSIESVFSDATNSGDVYGTGGASGGCGGYFELNAQGGVVNSGSLYFDGGTNGGEGGQVEMDSGSRVTTNTAALITVLGIPNGKIIIDLWDVTPADGTIP